MWQSGEISENTWGQLLRTLHFTMVAFRDVLICYLYFHERIHFQHGWTEQSVWPVIGCDCALHKRWSSELSFGGSCSITGPAASSQSETDQYLHRGPLITTNRRETVSICNINQSDEYFHNNLLRQKKKKTFGQICYNFFQAQSDVFKCIFKGAVQSPKNLLL